MSARSTITANDGETTPVAHVFPPAGYSSPGVNLFVNRNTTVPAASETIHLSVKRSNAEPGAYSTPGLKVAMNATELRVRYPSTYTDGVSGLELVDFVDEIIVTARYHPRSSDQHRKNLHTIMRNCFNSTMVLNAFLGDDVY
jgi:hypothetical protein